MICLYLQPKYGRNKKLSRLSRSSKKVAAKLYEVEKNNIGNRDNEDKISANEEYIELCNKSKKFCHEELLKKKRTVGHRWFPYTTT